MNLLSALKEVPVGWGGLIRNNVIVTVIKNSGVTHQMKLLNIDRQNNNVEFRNISAGTMGTRNFYWDRLGRDGQTDFTKRCVVSSVIFHRGLVSRSIEIFVEDPGRGAGPRYRR